jgi:NADH-quinone oxidoreductase subunit C
MNCGALKQKLAASGAGEITETEYARKGFALDVRVAPEQLIAAVSVLDAEGFFIEAVTGVDWLGEQAALRKEAEAKAAAEAKAKAEAAVAAGEEPPPAEPPAEQGELAEDALEAVYDFNHYESFCRVTIRTRVVRSKPEIPTISRIYPGANWHERETHDFFGIIFVGHPYLVPLLLPEDADFHPLLKDFRP